MKNKVTKLKNIQIQINHHESALGDLIDDVEHMADRHHLKQAIIKMAEVRKHLKFAITGIKATGE